VPPGTYSLSFSATGYQPLTAVMVTVTTGATTTQNEALIPTAHQPVFSDGFESGDLSAWTSSKHLTIESGTVHSGTFAAEGNVTALAAYAQKQFAATYSTSYARDWFYIVSHSTQINVLGVRDFNAGNIAYLWVSSTGTLGLNAKGVGFSSSTLVSIGTWHELELSAVINGASSSTQVWLDGGLVGALSLSSVNLGLSPVGIMQLGWTMASQTWDVAFDDAAFDSQLLP
jgi:hypothetical protein